jgi:predicted DNA-binding protein (UPF0251 family)
MKNDLTHRPFSHLKYEDLVNENKQTPEGPVTRKRTHAELKPLYREAVRLIREQGLTHLAAAKKVGLHQGQVSRYIRNRNIRAKRASAPTTEGTKINLKAKYLEAIQKLAEHGLV